MSAIAKQHLQQCRADLARAQAKQQEADCEKPETETSKETIA